jgi:phosphohistidine phosphatase
MKILTLVRHAKSSWKYADLDDLDRPLNRRGQRDAPLMGDVMAARGCRPDAVFTSPALRALRTAEVIAAAIGYPQQRIVLDGRLYHADSDDLLEVVKSMDAPIGWVVCVGHNPGLTDLANHLGRQRFDNVPTCGVVEMRFDSDRWVDVDRTAPQGVDFEFPKKHRLS